MTDARWALLSQTTIPELGGIDCFVLKDGDGKTARNRVAARMPTEGWFVLYRGEETLSGEYMYWCVGLTLNEKLVVDFLESGKIAHTESLDA